MRYAILFEDRDLSGSYMIAFKNGVVSPETVIMVEADTVEEATEKLHNLEFCRSIGITDEDFFRKFQLKEV